MVPEAGESRVVAGERVGVGIEVQVHVGVDTAVQAHAVVLVLRDTGVAQLATVAYIELAVDETELELEVEAGPVVYAALCNELDSVAESAGLAVAQLALRDELEPPVELGTE